MTNRKPFGRQSRRALTGFYYLRAEHARLRRDPVMIEANARPHVAAVGGR